MAGLVKAEVHFDGPLQRGENALLAQLTPLSDADAPRLLAVDALMAAHAHQAHARSIDDTPTGYEARSLDLFMAGRWQVELSLGVAERRDSVSFAVDVP
jgi:hypothetical protein